MDIGTFLSPQKITATGTRRITEKEILLLILEDRKISNQP
jgi:hypothetical protein